MICKVRSLGRRVGTCSHMFSNTMRAMAVRNFFLLIWCERTETGNVCACSQLHVKYVCVYEYIYMVTPPPMTDQPLQNTAPTGDFVLFQRYRV